MAAVQFHFEIRGRSHVVKMADETEPNFEENHENTSFKDLVSAKLKYLLVVLVVFWYIFALVNVFGRYFRQGVTEVLCEACEKVGWKKPTKIQRECIPLALQGRLRRVY